MRAKAESTIASYKSRANNLIVLVQFLIEFSVKTRFQSFLIFVLIKLHALREFAWPDL